MLDGVCAYLNRHWVSREKEERGDTQSVYEIKDLGLVNWRSELYKVKKLNI